MFRGLIALSVLAVLLSVPAGSAQSADYPPPPCAPGKGDDGPHTAQWQPCRRGGAPDDGPRTQEAQCAAAGLHGSYLDVVQPCGAAKRGSSDGPSILAKGGEVRCMALLRSCMGIGR